MSYEISVIMVVKNEVHNLRMSFPVLLRQEIPHAFEILVIDSGSKDGSMAYLESLSREKENIRILQIPPEEFHHARTRNLGAALARGEYLVYLGGDAVPECETWLYNLTRPVMEGEWDGIAASYGRQKPRPGADINNVCRMSFNYGSTSFMKSAESNLSKKSIYFFSTVNCCINRRMAGSPIFDESIVVDEDVSYSYRIINQGYKIAYCSDACVAHSHNYGRIDILRRYFDNSVIYRQIGIFSSRESSVHKDGIEYVKHSMALLRQGRRRDWLTFGQFLAFSYAGLKLGQLQRILPRFIGRKISRYRTV